MKGSHLLLVLKKIDVLVSLSDQPIDINLASLLDQPMDINLV